MRRSWWTAAGAALAVAALAGVVAVLSAGSPGPGGTGDAAAGSTVTRDGGTSDGGTSDGGISDGGISDGGTGDRGTGGDARRPAPTGVGVSGDTGTAAAPRATSRPVEPPPRPGPRPQPSVVAPRAQAPRPDLPLGLAIQSYEVVAPQRLSLRYATGLPECYGALDRAYVSESGDRVLITLRVRPVAHPSNEPCPDIAVTEDTLVGLDEPLGDRTVVDGATGRAVARGHASSPG